MSHNYIVSAKKPTVVTDAVVGNFTDIDDLNLVLAKINRIQIYKVTCDGLKLLLEVPIFGRIEVIKLFRAERESRDSLLVFTAKHQISILGWDTKEKTVVTRASGNLADRVGRPSEHGIVVTIHKSGIIAIRINEGILKVVKWSDGSELKCFNARFEDLRVVDLTFMSSEDDDYKIAYIAQDTSGRHLKVVELNMIDKELKMIHKLENIENEACMLIPVPYPYGGVVVVGQENLLYYKDERQETISVSPALMAHAQIVCYGTIDASGKRFLISDQTGRLLMLLLDLDGGMDDVYTVRDMKLEYLGETSIAQCVVYLDNSVVFVGSRFGDSQLIRLESEPNEGNSFVTTLDCYTNIGPIRDMTVIEADGQSHLVTCSGGFKDGSLRIIRNGIGIEEMATVDLPGIKKLFSLRVGSNFDNFVVVSLDAESLFIKIDGEELDNTTLFDFVSNETTIWSGCVDNSSSIIQIVSSGMIICSEGKDTVRWTPPRPIDLVSANTSTGQIALTCGNIICYLIVDGMAVNEEATREMPYEISCVDISSIEASQPSHLIALTYWAASNNSVSLLSLPKLETISEEQLPVEVLPRSILITKMDRIIHLLVALGDGTLYYYNVDSTTGALCDVKVASLGTQPPSLHRFDSNGNVHIFACSDRPVVIFSSSNKLVFSNVNLKQLNQICQLNSDAFRNCLAMADGEKLFIGKVDDIQKLHIRTIPLGESPKRIVHQKETGTLGVLVYRDESSDRMSISKALPKASTSSSKPETGARTNPPDGFDVERHSLIILDQNTYEPLHCHEFAPHEHACSIHSSRLGEDKNTYYIVGTSMVYNDETESRIGRIIIFQAGTGEDRYKLTKISEKEIKGCPYSIATLGTKLLVTVNSSVRLFEWPEADRPELRLECSHFNHIAALYLKVQGDQVVVGDMMRSMCILSYKTLESSFEEVARDFRQIWMTAVEFIDAETCIGAETKMNIFSGEIDRGNAEEKTKLKDSGQYYLGEVVNVFRKGSLVSSHVDNQLPIDKPILYGTVDGSIGLVVQVTEAFHAFLTELERRVAKETNNCMRLDHATYRQFHKKKHIDVARGFVDGDLIESVLEWTRDKIANVFQDLIIPGSTSSSPDDILKIVEDLSRIH